MSTVTLQNLRDQIRARADMQYSGFVDDTELDFYINSAAQELYDLLATKFEDYYLTVANFTINAGVSTTTLPNDFYKLKGVDIDTGNGQYVAAVPFTFMERNKVNNPILFPLSGLVRPQYRVRNSTLEILGQANSQSSITGRIWYLPTFTKLVNASDTLDGVNGWEEYVIIEGAIRCKDKEESDTSVLIDQKKKMKKRIDDIAPNRDIGSPETVTDTYAGSDDWMPFRRF